MKDADQHLPNLYEHQRHWNIESLSQNSVTNCSRVCNKQNAIMSAVFTGTTNVSGGAGWNDFGSMSDIAKV